MKLTPLDIRHKEFKRGMRGYVDGEVDEFLDEIADEFERLFKENIELTERLETMQEKIDQYRNLEETLQNTLVAAQRSAEELRANAQKEAQLMLSEAELKARQMVNQSYGDKQAVEKQIVVLKSSEQDFRFKFRSLLEGYTKQLAESEADTRKAAQFAGQGEQIKDAMEGDAVRHAGVPAARPMAPARPAPFPAAPAAAPETPAATRPDAPAPGASRPAAAPAAAPDREAQRPLATPATPPSPDAQRADPESERPAATPAPDRTGSDPRAPFLGDPDDLLSDVDSEVDDNAFKW
jgi:cell division initiation protein